MTKDIKRRKTTMEERIKIVEYCISHSNDYASAAKEFNCSYGQVYSWVKKYVTDGMEGLRDGRGRNKPVFHSDRGYQYTSKTFQRKIVDAGMTQSMSRVGRCIDNGPMEGFWGIMKREMYYGRKYKTKEA